MIVTSKINIQFFEDKKLEMKIPKYLLKIIGIEDPINEHRLFCYISKKQHLQIFLSPLKLSDDVVSTTLRVSNEPGTFQRICQSLADRGINILKVNDSLIGDTGIIELLMELPFGMRAQHLDDELKKFEEIQPQDETTPKDERKPRIVYSHSKPRILSLIIPSAIFGRIIEIVSISENDNEYVLKLNPTTMSSLDADSIFETGTLTALISVCPLVNILVISLIKPTNQLISITARLRNLPGALNEILKATKIKDEYLIDIRASHTVQLQKDICVWRAFAFLKNSDLKTLKDELNKIGDEWVEKGSINVKPVR